MNTQRWLTVQEAADRLQASTKSVYRWLESGRLKGHRLGGSKLGWRIDPASVEALMTGDGGEIVTRVTAPDEVR